MPESEAPSAEPTEYTVLTDLFSTSEQPPPREHAKRRKGREEDEDSARKKERREIEDARKASLVDEEAHSIKAVELAGGVYNSRDVETAGGTTYSFLADDDTTEGVHTT